MNSCLNDKKEIFRKEIRRQRNEALFKQKRIIHTKNEILVGFDYDLLISKLKKQEYCDDLLEKFSELDLTKNIIRELLGYLNQTLSLQTIQIGLKCMNNLIYYNDHIYNLQEDCYHFLQKTFQIDDFITKSRTLACLGNLAHDHHEFIISVQNQFFKEDLLPLYVQEYSFLINVLSEYGEFSEMIRCLQFLAEIIVNYPTDEALEAVETIFKDCSPLEADELVDTHFCVPLTHLIKLAIDRDQAYKALLALLNKVNDSTKVNLFVRGFNSLIFNFINNPVQREQGLQLILEFTSRQTEDEEVNLLIDNIYQLFEDNKLSHILMEKCTPQQLLIICNSIKGGNINIFIEFLHLNIISKIFIPYLISDDTCTADLVIETIDVLLQRDELSSNQFQFIIKAFNTEQLKFILEQAYYRNHQGKQSDIHQMIDSILDVLNENP